MNKRTMLVPLYDKPGAKSAGSVEVSGPVRELVRIGLMLLEAEPIKHTPNEPETQSAKNFLRRHPELKPTMSVKVGSEVVKGPGRLMRLRHFILPCTGEGGKPEDDTL